ncbi:glutamine synthetase III [Clostridium cylindrosporum]|uniref:Glutamine synthetase GlnA n=1 Tax=Clostridium cylindrosporum DSM 605 TaxID=1121307 RepID=A0A0J8D5R2_CLOCY|nr:glutamine synthetase III [Clostridium cylindrosporum]KMT21192.1 glutamine synthetase GlnA [Clostridium cylindrosporum DSM 605]
MRNFCDGNCKKSISDMYAVNVFNDTVMRERLPKATYKALRNTIEEGSTLEGPVAEVVASAMKDWAVERGATHYTHWFQPMNGVTAEKHQSFIVPTSDGKVIMEFSGKELIKGEADGSSFPSGGLRATFEARGYTAWDPTSPAFLKEDEGGITLCIPTAFCSYTGEALDKKTPLLRSIEALQKQAIRVLRALGNTTSNRVITTVGPEQEYFLVDRDLYKNRKDLVYTGRTLFGAKPPKGQEMDDHYYGCLKERVASFMKDIDEELWKLGVSAKTKHNEVAPAQHELAPVFTEANIAVDHNQLTMEVMKKVAARHSLACLLHEKPFAGLNGSGKHNNWSLSTDDGQNLLNPGKTPHENAQFLLFLCSVIKAVDMYPELLRASAASAGNDHRLGGHEAPPVIISIFLGDQLTDILEQIERGELKSSKQGDMLGVGVSSLPMLKRDTTDRNRTSPFAFTGNKFEFRMVQSSGSVSDSSIILNTIVADVLGEVAERLENSADPKAEIEVIVREMVINHKRIIFNGDGYSNEWIEEATKERNLPNLPTTVDAIPALISEKAIKLFEKHKVLNTSELFSRYEVQLEEYTKQINIEALTMIEIGKREITPAVIKYITEVSDSIIKVKSISESIDTTAQEKLINKLTSTLNNFNKALETLEKKNADAKSVTGDILNKAMFYRDEVLKVMIELRSYGDELEGMVDGKLWPFPTYGELLFYL